MSRSAEVSDKLLWYAQRRVWRFAYRDPFTWKRKFIFCTAEKFRQAGIPGQLRTRLDVGCEDERAHAGRQFLVLVLAPHLVFHEVLRLFHLADVVEGSCDSDQEAIGLDGLGTLLRQGPDHHRVVIGARCLDDHLADQRMVETSEFKQAAVGEEAERLEDRY